MIVGLGLDLVDISRIAASWERFGSRFAARVLRPEELETMPASPINYLAARFAAKEAAVKALGTGFTVEVGFQDLCVSRLPSGQPQMIFFDGALLRMRALGADSSFLSMTHSEKSAGAVLILTAKSKQGA